MPVDFFLYYSQFQTESVLVFVLVFMTNSTSLMFQVIFQQRMNQWSGENI